MTFELPTGKGWFTWQCKCCGDDGTDTKRYTGTADKVIVQCKKANITHIIVKCLGGYGKYNMRPIYDSKGKLVGYVDDLLKPWVATIKAAGIKVFGYQYNYLEFPEKEGDAAIQRVEEMGLDGLYLDVEMEAYNKCADSTAPASRFAKRLLNRNFPVSLCSFRFPVTMQPNPAFYNILLNVCDFVSPQVYWEGSHNVADQLEWSYLEYNEGRTYRGKFVKGLNCGLPYLPDVSAYKHGDWYVTVEDVIALMDKAKSMEMASLSWWEWAHTKLYLPEDWDAIAAYQYGEAQPDPEPDPDDPPVEQPTIEKRVTSIENAIKANTDWDLS
jgi:hypothetical protein